MKNAKRIYIVLLTVSVLVAGNMAVRAQSAQQSGDQSKTDSNPVKQSEKKSTDGAASTEKKNSNNAASAAPNATLPGRAPAKAPSSPTAATPKTSPANNAGMVWVNTESGVYHKPGTRWYGKTKQGKYMTEADAIKAGYKASARN